ncbi:L-fuculokinase [Oryzobacter terrae]|uniref:FGGY-family carbohydrate kinase n=1 Tax=Oryzobacter terrae TaxID=1620385 RepID=UPI00366D7E9B
MSLLGVDLGTSGVRVGATDASGRVLVRVGRSSRPTTPGPDLAEVDADQVVADTVALLAEVAAHPALEADPPLALSVCSQGEAAVPVDAAGRALAPAPVSRDRRGAGAVEGVVARVGAAQVQRISGQPVHPMFTLYRVAAEPGLWSSATVRGLRCLPDYVMGRLGGRGAGAVTDTTVAARTGLLDVERRTWSAELADASGVDLAWLPEVVDPGTVVGGLAPGVAAATGLAAGLPLVVASHDQATSWWGGGGSVGETSVFSFGSSDCLTIGTPGRPDGLVGTGVATYPGPADTWLTLAGTAAGGWALDWFGRTVGASDPAGLHALLDAASEVPAALLVLPYLAGSGTLDNDPAARGAVVGLALDTTRADLARAFLEAGGYELRKIAAGLADLGIVVGAVLAVGAGALSRRSLGIRADAAGRTLTVGADAGALRGAALQAAVGIGLHASFADLPRPPVLHAAEPDPALVGWFASQGRRYADLYAALAPLGPPNAAPSASPDPTNPHHPSH